MDPIGTFRAHLPVRIAFGDGAIAELPDALEALGATAALLVVEEPVAEHRSVVDALTTVERADVRVDRVVKGPGEPTFALADELAERVRGGGLDAVVGIGGGGAGVCWSPKDLEYAAELLGQLAFDPDMRTRVIARQRTRLEDFSEARIVGRLKDICSL